MSLSTLETSKNVLPGMGAGGRQVVQTAHRMVLIQFKNRASMWAVPHNVTNNGLYYLFSDKIAQKVYIFDGNNPDELIIKDDTLLKGSYFRYSFELDNPKFIITTFDSTL